MFVWEPDTSATKHFGTTKLVPKPKCPYTSGPGPKCQWTTKCPLDTSALLPKCPDTSAPKGRVKMWGCGADLEHRENAGRIYRPIGVHAGLLYELADLRIWSSGAVLTYLLISLKRSCGLDESTELPSTNQSIVISLRITYPTDLQACL